VRPRLNRYNSCTGSGYSHILYKINTILGIKVKSLIFVMHSIACMDIFVQLNIELKCQ